MLSCLRHNRYPEHSRRILLQVPSEPDEPAARVAVPIAPEPRPMRALVLHLRSVLEGNCCGSLRVCVLLVAGAAGGLQALTRRSTSEVYEHARVSKMRGLEQPRCFRQLGKFLPEARGMALPNLPFAARRFDRDAARIDAGLFDVATAKAAGAEFDGDAGHRGSYLRPQRCQRSSRANRLDVSQRLPPIFSTSE